MALTDTAIKALKPQTKAYKISDEKGLYLFVTAAGGKLWRLDYRFEGKRKTLALGGCPDVNLKQARTYRDESRQLIANGIDPAELRKAEKNIVSAARREEEQTAKIEAMVRAGEALPGSFEEIALEWFAKQEPGWALSHSGKIMARLRADVFPFIGLMPITGITAPIILKLLERIENRGTVDTAHRAK
jgi:hypothetical protein